MKKISLFIFVLLMVGIMSQDIAYSRPNTAIVKVTIQAYWAHYFPALFVDKCGGTGDDCLVITITVVGTVGISNGPGNGFYLDIPITSIVQNNDVIPYPSESGDVYPSITGYTFPANSIAKIVSSDDPSLIGIQWSISNQTTDANAQIHKYFPN